MAEAYRTYKLAELVAASENILDQADCRCAAETAGDDDHVTSACLFDRPPVPIWPADTDYVADLPICHHPGDPARDSNRMFENLGL